MDPTRDIGGTSEAGVRGRLMKAATDLFARQGYAGTTVREIVAAAGVTKPVLYYWFRSKEGIYLELLRTAFGDFEALLSGGTGERGGARERICRLCDRAFARFESHLEVARVMYAIYYGPPQGAPFFDFDAYHRRLQEHLEALVREGVRRGELRRASPEEMSLAITGVLTAAMELRLSHPDRGVDRRALARLLSLLFEGLERAPARRSGRTR